MLDYIVAKPCSGRPTVLRVFQDYDVAKLVAGEGEIVTNAGFVSRKGNSVPKKFSRIKWPVTRPLFRRVLKNIKRAA